MAQDSKTLQHLIYTKARVITSIVQLPTVTTPPGNILKYCIFHERFHLGIQTSNKGPVIAQDGKPLQHLIYTSGPGYNLHRRTAHGDHCPRKHLLYSFTQEDLR